MLGLIKAALDFLAGLLGLGKQAMSEVHDQAQRNAGQAEQKTVDQGVALEAEHRMDAAEAKANETSQDLNDGTF